MTQRRVPRWLVWIGVPVLALALLVAFWSWDWFIPLAERQASAALGRPVHIAHLRVKLGRVVEVSAEDLRVDNPEGFPGDPPFAQVPRLTVRLDAMAYLREREVVIPAIEVERPAVQMLALADGRTNYAFGAGGAAPAGEGAPAANNLPRDRPEGGAAIPRIDVLRITDGTAHVAIPNLRADFQMGISTRDEETPEPRIAVEANGTYAGQRITGTALLGGPLFLLEKERPWPLQVRLENGPTNVSIDGTIQNPLALQGADVKVDLQGPDMALLQPLSGVPFPHTPAYRARGHLDYAQGRVRFRDFDGKVGSSDLSGTIAVTTGGERPDVVADLRSRRVDLADLGGFIGEEPGRRNTPGQTAQQRRELARNERSARVLPSDPISLPKLNSADVHLKYRADAIQGRNTPFDNMRAEMEVVNGAVTLKPLAIGVGRGQIAGNISLTPQENDALKAEVDVQFQRLDVSRLMRATGTFEGAGSLGGRARIEGTGNSMAQILGRGNGALTLSMAGGGNLSALLVDLSGIRLANSILSFLKLPDRTQVECFVADFALQRGVLDTRALLVDTENVLITGTGKVDLGRERLDYNLRSDSKGFTVGQLAAPVTIGGTFRDPDVGLEVGELAVRGGAAIGLGFLFPPLAILPTIQLGVGDDKRCDGLARRAQGGSQGDGRNGAGRGR